MHTIIIIITTSLVLGASAASLEDIFEMTKGTSADERGRCLLDRLDVDGDGDVSAEDLALAPAASLHAAAEACGSAVQTNRKGTKIKFDASFASPSQPVEKKRKTKFHSERRGRRLLSSEQCRDTNYGILDAESRMCNTYDADPTRCGLYDTVNFNSTEHCCACGGGRQIQCIDADLNSFRKDAYGDSCSDYQESWCGGDGDDDDFTARQDCCICGGGVEPYCNDQTNDGLFTDSWGDGCEYYRGAYVGQCGRFDDADFQAMDMCCACSGGSPCGDTNGWRRDNWGDPCTTYALNPHWCGGRYDDDDFSADEMCCACGGGVSSNCLVPTIAEGVERFAEPECVMGEEVATGQTCTIVSQANFSCVSPGLCQNGNWQEIGRCRTLVCDASGTCNRCSFRSKSELSSELTVWRSGASKSDVICTSIGTWDTSNVTDMAFLFYNMPDVGSVDLTMWNTAKVTDFSHMFWGATQFNSDIGHFNVSSATTMYGMFHEARAFNGDISRWDVSNVADMSYAFYDANQFNANLSAFDTSSVETMVGMFWNASSFVADGSQSLASWNVARVEDFGHMFRFATSFRGETGLSAWNTRRAVDMTHMFYGSAFEGTLEGWDTSSVTDMEYMFASTSSFGDDGGGIGDWATQSVTSMLSMFEGAETFSGDLRWDTRRVTDMRNMFRDTASFDADISALRVDSVTSFDGMFQDASKYGTQTWDPDLYDLKGWRTSKVKSAISMFDGASKFNGDISNWDVSAVTSMRDMFHGASVFNGDVSRWNTANVRDMSRTFMRSGTFNSDLGAWNVLRVRDMSHMFEMCSKFEGTNISNWNTSSLENMNRMFFGAAQFDLNLASWNVVKVTSMDSTFEYAGALTDCHKSLIAETWYDTLPDVFEDYAIAWKDNARCTCAPLGTFEAGVVGGSRSDEGCVVGQTMSTGTGVDPEENKCAVRCDYGYSRVNSTDDPLAWATCSEGSVDGSPITMNIECERNVSEISVLCGSSGCSVSDDATDSVMTSCDPSVERSLVGTDGFRFSTSGEDRILFSGLNVPFDPSSVGDGTTTAKGPQGEAYFLGVDDEHFGERCDLIVANSATLHTLSCLVPQGVGMRHTIDLYQSDAAMTSEPMPTHLLKGCKFDYAAPKIDVIGTCTDGSPCAREGGSMITVHGRNFGKSDALVFINGRACAHLRHGASNNTDCADEQINTECHHVIHCQVPSLATISREDNSMVVIMDSQFNWFYGVRYVECQPNEFQHLQQGENEYYNCQTCEWGKSSSQSDAVSCSSCTLLYLGSTHCDLPIMGAVLAFLSAIALLAIAFVGYRSWSKQKRRAHDVQVKNEREQILRSNAKQRHAIDDYVRQYGGAIRENEAHDFKIAVDDRDGLTIKKEIDFWIPTNKTRKFWGELDLPADKDVPVIVKVFDLSKDDGAGVEAQRHIANIAFDEKLVRELHFLGRHERMLFVYGHAHASADDVAKHSWSLITEYAYSDLRHMLWSSKKHKRKKQTTARGGGRRDRSKSHNSSSVAERNQHDSLYESPSWSERLQWALDIAEALKWLDSNKHAHGNLSSMSCYVHIDFVNAVDEQDNATTRLGAAAAVESPPGLPLKDGGGAKASSKSDQELVYRRRIKVGDLRMERNVASAVPSRRRSSIRRNRSMRFGWARKASGLAKKATKSATKGVRFSPWWAPEIMRGAACRDVVDDPFVEHRMAADVYALGIIMSEMYTLRRPWGNLWESGNRVLETSLRKTICRGIRPTLPVQDDAPLGFYHLMTHAYRQNPSDRPRARTMASKLREILDGESDKRAFRSHRKLLRRKSTSSRVRGVTSAGANLLADMSFSNIFKESKRKSPSRRRGSTSWMLDATADGNDGASKRTLPDTETADVQGL